MITHPRCIYVTKCIRLFCDCMKQLTGCMDGLQACIAANHLFHAVIMNPNALGCMYVLHVVNSSHQKATHLQAIVRSTNMSWFGLLSLSVIVGTPVHSRHCRCVSMSMIPSTSKSLKLQAKV